jgi:hypothetical protein
MHKRDKERNMDFMTWTSIGNKIPSLYGGVLEINGMG